jgi:hypothetical protein
VPRVGGGGLQKHSELSVLVVYHGDDNKQCTLTGCCPPNSRLSDDDVQVMRVPCVMCVIRAAALLHCRGIGRHMVSVSCDCLRLSTRLYNNFDTYLDTAKIGDYGLF